MWLNHAKFMENGECGYVMKPPLMLETRRFDPVNNPKFYQRFTECYFTITIIVLVGGTLILRSNGS